MAAYVFVSKDADEYNKYLCANCYPVFISDNAMVKGESVDYLVAPTRPLQLKEKCNDYIVVVNSQGIPAKRKLAATDRTKINCEDAKRYRDTKASVCEFLAAINVILQYASVCLESRNSAADFFRQKSLIEQNQPEQSQEQVVVFVHWGFGDISDILKAENVLQAAIDKWNVEKIDKGNGKEEDLSSIKRFPGLKIFSLSSRRQSLFDVTGTRIRIPVEREELQSLVARFKNGQAEEACVRCAVKDGALIAANKDELISLLTLFKNRLLSSHVKLGDKKENLKKIAVALHEIEEGSVNVSTEVASFFAKILNREVFNG